MNVAKCCHDLRKILNLWTMCDDLVHILTFSDQNSYQKFLDDISSSVSVSSVSR